MIENIEPGQYRTRCGIVATVSDSDDKLHPPFYWVGYAADEIEVWDRHGRYYINGKDSPLDLVARLPDESPADDRIERALQVLRNVQTYDCHSVYVREVMRAGRHNAGDWVEAEVLSEVRKILESTP
jgi:hypothetical protein